MQTSTLQSALGVAEREATEALKAATLAQQRSADYSSRNTRASAGRAAQVDGARPRGGYAQLLDGAEPARESASARRADDAPVACGGIAPPEAEDAAEAGGEVDEARGDFSFVKKGHEGALSGKSGCHWIPMVDVRASRKTGRVNCRLLLASPRLHARVLCRLPLVIVVWLALILDVTLAFFAGVAPGLAAYQGALPIALTAVTFFFCTLWMMVAAFSGPGAIPVSEEQTAMRAHAEEERDVCIYACVYLFARTVIYIRKS